MKLTTFSQAEDGVKFLIGMGLVGALQVSTKWLHFRLKHMTLVYTLEKDTSFLSRMLPT
jgi:hypothetical protein